MKKIFTLFLGLIIALGAFAAPQDLQLRNAKVGHKDKKEIKIEDVKKRAPRKIKLDGEPSAVIDITCTNLAVEDFYGVLYIMSASNDQYEVEAYLYPEEDLYTDYSSDLENISFYIYDYANDAELEVSADGKLSQAADGTPVFTGVAIDENNRQFNLNLSYVIPEAKDTINLVFNDPVSALYYNETGDFYISAYNEETGWLVYLDIFTDELEGSFTSADFDDYYTYLVHFGEDTTYFDMITAQADIIKTETGAIINAGILADDENFYQFSLTYIKPVAKDTVSLEILDAELNEDYLDWYGFTALEGITADGEIALYIAVPGEFETGEFTFKDLYTSYSSVTIGEDDYAFVDGTFSVIAADTLIKVEGSLLAQNDVLYNFILSKEITPIVAKDTVKIDFKELGNQRYYEDTEDFYFVVANKDYLLTLDIFTDERPGSYDTDDFDLYYTGLYKIEGTDTIPFEIIDIKAEITESGDRGQVNAEFLASDSIFYIVTFTFGIFIEDSTVEISITDGKLIDLIADMGAFQVLGYTDDGKYAVSFVIENNQIEGEYTVEDLIYQGQYTYIDTPNGGFTIVEGKISVKVNGTIIVVDAEVTASNGVLYIISMRFDTATGLVNTQGTNKLGSVQKIMQNGQIYIIKDGVIYNALGKVVE